MNSQHRAIRALLSEMSAERATDYIRAFRLTEREELCIMEKEVHDLSYAQICRKYGFSPELVRNTRRKAFAKMVDAIQYCKEEHPL